MTQRWWENTAGVMTQEVERSCGSRSWSSVLSLDFKRTPLCIYIYM
jgi:hypothetical protein